MEQLRHSLHEKLDTLLHDIVHEADFTGTHLRIEACIYHTDRAGPDRPIGQPESRRLIIDTIDLKDLPLIRSTPTANQFGLPSPESGQGDQDRSTRQLQSFDRSNTIVHEPASSRSDVLDECRSHKRRKDVGGLHLRARNEYDSVTLPRTSSPPVARTLESDGRQFPKRRKTGREGPAKLEQSTVDKLIEGVWEQVHRPATLALGQTLRETFESIARRITATSPSSGRHASFEEASRCCQQVTSGSRTSRALEVIVQAHWVDRYDAHIKDLLDSRPDLKTTEARKLVMNEACVVFKWSEKELRNRLGIWKGYREIKNAAGWAALVFAGPGIYRFCKYRLGFDPEALSKLNLLRSRLEVAADTLQPQWRELLALVGEPTQLHWRGHPHDWVVSKRQDPVPLALTYKQWDPQFTFTHLEESILDVEKWGTCDPRRSAEGPEYICGVCDRPQSSEAGSNECECFPDLFGANAMLSRPVQIFRTENGRNNGLMACCTFERGAAIGEFVGLITRGLSNMDVMQSQVTTSTGKQQEPFQIWQGRQGNFTRFINHSCQPNCQFQTFVWLGVQRTLVVSKGVPAGREITVDYSDRYWQHLDKVCLCGEPKCRYPDRVRSSSQLARVSQNARSGRRGK